MLRGSGDRMVKASFSGGDFQSLSLQLPLSSVASSSECSFLFLLLLGELLLSNLGFDTLSISASEIVRSTISESCTTVEASFDLWRG